MGDEVDRRVPGQRGARRARPVDDLEDALGQEGRDELGEAPPEVRAALAGLVHDGVAGDERRADQAPRHGHRVVPRRDHRGDPAGLGDHEVGRVPRALQRAPAVQRAQLGVLLERPGRGQHPAQGVVVGPPGLGLVEARELLGDAPQRPGGVAHQAGAVTGRRAGPGVAGGARPAHGGVDLVGARGADAAHELPGRGVVDLDGGVGGSAHGVGFHLGAPGTPRPARSRGSGPSAGCPDPGTVRPGRPVGEGDA